MKNTKVCLIGRCWLAAATVLAGGTVLGTCEVRLREALVNSTKSLALGVFDNAVQDLGGSIAVTTGTAEETAE